MDVNIVDLITYFVRIVIGNMLSVSVIYNFDPRGRTRRNSDRQVFNPLF